MISPFFQCATVQNSIRNFLLVGAISLPSDPFIGPRIVPIKAANRRVGSYQEVGTYRSTFAVISLWGKFGGLRACGDTFPHIVPLPNIFLTRLFSKQTFHLFLSFFNLCIEHKRVRKIFGSGTMCGNVSPHAWSPPNFPHSEITAKVLR